ncbi:MAG: hypothetical protein SGJ24_00820 [Chloroflexota bacterium]|nr:hypothetical protein [Chloroflexota bacterium]
MRARARCQRWVRRTIRHSPGELLNMRVQSSMRALMRGYTPQPFDGTLLYFTCRYSRLRQPPDRIEPREQGWARLAAGEFLLIDLHGKHESQLDDPEVLEVVPHVRRVVTRGAIASAAASAQTPIPAV